MASIASMDVFEAVSRSARERRKELEALKSFLSFSSVHFSTTPGSRQT